jgi:hypothetical protein
MVILMTFLLMFNFPDLKTVIPIIAIVFFSSINFEKWRIL